MSQVTKVKQISVLFHTSEQSPALALGWKNSLLRMAKGSFGNATNLVAVALETLSLCEKSPSSAPSTEVSGEDCPCQRSVSHQSEWDP